MDLLEQLATVSVPTAPDFTAGVRRKLHPRLLAVHIAEFGCGAMAWAVRHFGEAVCAAIRYSVTGTWPRGPEGGDRLH